MKYFVYFGFWFMITEALSDSNQLKEKLLMKDEISEEKTQSIFVTLLYYVRCSIYFFFNFMQSKQHLIIHLTYNPESSKVMMPVS